LVNGVALLSLADDFAKILDWVGRFEEMQIVSLPPTPQPLHKTRHPQPRARRRGYYATIFGKIKRRIMLSRPEWTGVVATDVSCTGSCPIFTLVRVVPTAVEA
jgi:hypothetical protein